MQLTLSLRQKYDALKNMLQQLGAVAVAFSGGVDSTLLLKVAHDVLGERCRAVTIRSLSFPEAERQQAEAFCSAEGIGHTVCEFDELSIEGFAKNPPNRCYICKKALFGNITKLAQEANIPYVVEGSNTDDLGDYRPGLQAIKELGIRSPLCEAQLNKEEIRTLSQYLGLSTYNKPSLACLSSRFAYGEEITAQKLKMVGDAEALLFSLGCSQCRVRMHGELARIELFPEEFSILMEKKTRALVVDALKKLGFRYITMDLIGFRSGSMNEILAEKEF